MDEQLHGTIGLLASGHEALRTHATRLLADIGPPAVSTLAQHLQNPNANVRKGVARVLRIIGDANMLPQLVLTDNRLSAALKLRTLEILRAIDYRDRGGRIRFYLPDIPQYCISLLNTDQDALRKGAREVISEWDRISLVRPGSRDRPRERFHLLRAPRMTHGDDPAHCLVRSAIK